MDSIHVPLHLGPTVGLEAANLALESLDVHVTFFDVNRKLRSKEKPEAAKVTFDSWRRVVSPDGVLLKRGFPHISLLTLAAFVRPCHIMDPLNVVVQCVEGFEFELAKGATKTSSVQVNRGHMSCQCAPRREHSVADLALLRSLVLVNAADVAEEGVPVTERLLADVANVRPQLLVNNFDVSFESESICKDLPTIFTFKRPDVLMRRLDM